MDGPLCGIVLAAGRGRRFGSNKIAARLPDGMAVGLAAARNLETAVDRMLVVIAERNGETEALFQAAGYTTVYAEDAGAGMAHSLACGVRSSADSGAWIIALADMPFVAATTMTKLAAMLRSQMPIVVPRFNGQGGHPVGFAARFADELSALSGDRGAREIVERHATLVHYLDSDDAGIIRDIDTPEDLAQA